MFARTLGRRAGPAHLRLAGVRTVLYNQDSVRVFPVVVAAARRTPAVTLCFPTLAAVALPHRDAPDVIFNRVPVAVRALV